jgi:ParB-like chromosome segregation protein Spo0J
MGWARGLPGAQAEAAAPPCAVHAVPVGLLRGGHSPRLNGEDAQHIQLIAQAQAPLPPILVQRGTMRVIDGMHRLWAARLLGRPTIDALFFDGEDADALIAAVRANTGHGLPLTLADRVAAGERIVALLPWRSDRWIAEVTGLAPATVGVIRRRCPASQERAGADPAGPSQAGACPAGIRVGRDGRARPVDIAERRRLAASAIRRHPDASLRVIAAMAGISPGTVRDVRQRVLRGEDPVGPARQPRPAGHPARDRGTLLRDLRKDPSLRLTERGRELLAWLAARAAGPAGLDDLVSGVPEHCLYLVARLARQCADEWQGAASRLEERLDRG